MRELKTLVLESDRLILRPVSSKDTVSLFRNWAGDSLASKYYSFESYEKPQDFSDYLDFILHHHGSDECFWVIELKNSHECIGMIEAERKKKTYVNVEIGFSIGSKYYGCGYATEAVKRMIQYLFKECRAHIVTAHMTSAFEEGGKVYERAGMRKEVVLKDRRIHPDTHEYCDLNVYSILEEDYLWIR